MSPSDTSVPIDRLRSVLEAHSVRFAVLFGSHSTGDAHARSDVDVAVEFDDVSPGDPEYNDVRFGLDADLAIALERDDVDLLDVQTADPSVVRRILEEGVLLVGSERRRSEIRDDLPPYDDDRSPRQRFDAALDQIEDHLA